MGFLKNIANALFGSGSGHDENGLYYYVRLHHVPNRQSPQDEIVEIRLDSRNDLSLADNGDYFVRKTVVGPKNFRRGEMTVYFDKRKKLKDTEISGGELVSHEDYQAYLAVGGDSDKSD